MSDLLLQALERQTYAERMDFAKEIYEVLEAWKLDDIDFDADAIADMLEGICASARFEGKDDE